MARFLIVDDSIISRKILKNIIVGLGHEVIAEASDGVEAYEIFSQQLPDIVTMDIAMPRMDGMEALKLIKSNCPQARVLMVSATNQETTIKETEKNGADYYLVKPVNRDKMHNALKNILEFADSRRENLPTEGTKPPVKELNVIPFNNTLKNIKQKNIEIKNIKDENIKTENIKRENIEIKNIKDEAAVKIDDTAATYPERAARPKTGKEEFAKAYLIEKRGSSSYIKIGQALNKKHNFAEFIAQINDLINDVSFKPVVDLRSASVLSDNVLEELVEISKKAHSCGKTFRVLSNNMGMIVQLQELGVKGKIYRKEEQVEW